VCWFSIYFRISSSFLQVSIVDPVVRIRYVAPVDPVMGATSPEITTGQMYKQYKEVYHAI